MKRKITEKNAVAAVMDGIFAQVDEKWGVIWEPVEKILKEMKLPLASSKFAKFNYQLAVIAVNFRAAFEIFPKEQAERLFTIMQEMLKKSLGDGKGFAAVQNTIGKYTEAYNNGILNIRNPLTDVSILLYYKVGFANTEQKVVDESYYAPEPKLIDYLAQSLMLFSGRWEMLLKRFEIVSAPATQDS